MHVALPHVRTEGIQHHGAHRHDRGFELHAGMIARHVEMRSRSDPFGGRRREIEYLLFPGRIGLFHAGEKRIHETTRLLKPRGLWILEPARGLGLAHPEKRGERIRRARAYLHLGNLRTVHDPLMIGYVALENHVRHIAESQPFWFGTANPRGAHSLST